MERRKDGCLVWWVDGCWPRWGVRRWRNGVMAGACWWDGWMNSSAEGGEMDEWERIASFSPTLKAYLVSEEMSPLSGACWRSSCLLLCLWANWLAQVSLGQQVGCQLTGTKPQLWCWSFSAATLSSSSFHTALRNSRQPPSTGSPGWLSPEPNRMLSPYVATWHNFISSKSLQWPSMIAVTTLN